MSTRSYHNWLPCLKPFGVFPLRSFPTGPCVIWLIYTSQRHLKSLCPFLDTHQPHWPPSVPWTCQNCLPPQKSRTCCTLYLESSLRSSQRGWLLPSLQFQLNYHLISKSFPDHPQSHSLSFLAPCLVPLERLPQSESTSLVLLVNPSVSHPCAHPVSST